MDWTTRHKITERTASLVHRLGELAHEIDADLLTLASTAARGEWTLLRASWPTAADVGSGIVALSDDDLDLMIGKVQRFKSILARLPVRRALMLVPIATA